MAPQTRKIRSILRVWRDAELGHFGLTITHIF